MQQTFSKTLTNLITRTGKEATKVLLYNYAPNKVATNLHKFSAILGDKLFRHMASQHIVIVTQVPIP